MAATLTQTSIIARKVIRFGIYALIFIIVARFTIGLGSRIYRNFFPEPPPPPTVKYGKLPNLPFPENAPTVGNITYSLETPDGELPEFDEQAKVYSMPKIPPTIQSLDFAKQKATSLGFSDQGRELVETVFIFPNSSAPSTITMNIVSGIFSISYDLRANPSAIESVPPSPETVTSQVRSFLARADLLSDDLSGPVTHDFIRIQEGRFVPALSLSDADLIKVNLFRKSFDDLPTVTDTPGEANVWFMISGAKDRANQIIAAEYHYYPIDEENFSTYPIISSQKAWEELNSQNAHVMRFDSSEVKNIKIRSVYLAYYDTGQYAAYFQPVVVFEGDNDFVAYVPAINEQYYGKEASE